MTFYYFMKAQIIDVCVIPETSQSQLLHLVILTGGEVLPEKLGGGVRGASQNSYPLLRPNSVIFPTLFMTDLT